MNINGVGCAKGNILYQIKIFILTYRKYTADHFNASNFLGCPGLANGRYKAS